MFNDKTGWKDDTKMIFKIDPSPYFLIFTDTRDESVILVKMVASIPSSTKLQIVEVDDKQEMQTRHSIFATGGTNYLLALGTNSRKIEICCVVLIDADNKHKMLTVIKLQNPVAIGQVLSITCRMMDLHVFLSSGIEFLSTVTGHQGFPSSITVTKR